MGTFQEAQWKKESTCRLSSSEKLTFAEQSRDASCLRQLMKKTFTKVGQWTGEKLLNYESTKFDDDFIELEKVFHYVFRLESFSF